MRLAGRLLLFLLVLVGVFLTACRFLPGAETSAPSTSGPARPEVLPAGSQPREWKGPVGPGKILALTFDDGPSPGLTQEYLDALDREGVRATFFLIGRHLERNPGLAALIAARGHEVGNHTFWHRDVRFLPEAAVRREIEATSLLIARETGAKVRFFRPPGGRTSARLERLAGEAGLATVLWDVDPGDWRRGATAGEIVRKVLAGVRPGAIVLLHEGREQTLAALPLLLRELKERGWQCVTLSELLEIRPFLGPAPAARGSRQYCFPPR